MNEKGRQTKLLAAIAVLAMVVCALAVVMPSEEVQGVETNVAPNSADNLQAAIDAAQPNDTLVLSAGDYGTSSSYSVYKIDKPLTIKAAENAEVNIYGGFAIYGLNGKAAVAVDGVSLQGLNIFVKGDDKQTLERSGITLLGKQVSITGCTFTLDENGELANAITIFPYGTSDANLDIKGNTFVGFKSTATSGSQEWSASGITVAEKYSMNDRFGSDSFTTTTLGLTPAQEDSLVDDNDYQDCTNVYDRTDYTDYDYDTTVPETNYTQDANGDIVQNNFSVAAGVTYTITGEESYTNVSVQGTLIVNGTLKAETIIVGENGKLSVGAAGTVKADSITASNSGIDAIYVADGSFTGSAKTNVTLVGSFGDEPYSGTLFVNKAGATGTVNFNADGSMYIRGNGSFDGTVNRISGNDTVASVDISFEGNGNSHIKFTGTTVEILGTQGQTIASGIYSDFDTKLNGVTANERYTVNLNKVTIGSITISSPINVTENVVIGSNETVIFDGENGKITLQDSAKLFVLGSLRAESDALAKPIVNSANGCKVYAMNESEVLTFVTTPGNVTDMSETDITITISGTGDNPEAVEALKTAQPGMTVNFTGSGKIVITDTLDLNGITIEIAERSDITIQIGKGTDAGQRASVTMEDVTVQSNRTDSSIVVSKGSSLDITESDLFIIVDAKDGSSVDVNNEDVVYQNTSSQVSVGYGTTLTLTGNVTSLVDVYGTLVIDSTATVPARTTMYVYQSGSLVVNGTLTILGEAEFKAGSSAEINGTVTVGEYATGGSVLDVDGDFVINENGTVTIAGVADNNRNKNILEAPATGYDKVGAGKSGYADMFEVYGTLAMNGTMSGFIHDFGTVSIDGTSTGATIVLYDGQTITIGSVSGTVNVTDKGILDESIREGQFVSDGNVVSLTNVENVTVSVVSERFDYVDTTGAEDKNVRNYRTVMSVSGEATAVINDNSATVLISSNDIAPVKSTMDDEASAYVMVAEGAELNFGNYVNFTVNHALVVDGGIEFFTAKNANPADNKEMTGSGPITVNGLIATSENAMAITNINAVKYVVKTTGVDATTTDYYTNFADAVAAALDADNDRITVLGNVTVGEDVSIATGIDVQIQNNGSITVGEDATVVLADGATITGGNTTQIVVEGTFTSQDYAEDLNVKAVLADVMSTQGASRTWTSLANAIESGMTEITLNRAITIEEDLTIPEGVTVTTNVAPAADNNNSSIYVDGATLTVNGTLAMLETTEGAITVNTEDEDSEIVINGVFYARTMTSAEPAAMANVAGAHFGIMSGASTYWYVSNIAFAAETASENDNLAGNTVTIKGIVSAGDVTFTSVEDLALNISIVKMTVDTTNPNAPENMTILSAGTITLGGNVNVQIGDNTRVSATFAAPCGDGTSNASVQMTNAQSVTLQTTVTEGASATEYDVKVSGEYIGAVTVSAGTVTADVIVGKDATLTVASGATMVIDNAGDLNVTATGDKGQPLVVIEGTLEVNHADGIDGIGAIEVSGTLDASKGLNIDTNTVRVTGTLSVADGEELVIGGTSANSFGKLILGDKPSQLNSAATGAVTGTVTFSPAGFGYILAYAGADLSGAAIQLNPATGESEAASTVYYINEAEYATIYAYGTSTLPVNSINGADGAIELNGYDTNPRWYETAEEAVAGQQEAAFGNTDRISAYDAAYAQFAVSDVPGTISQGTGLTIYIDGLTIDTYLTIGENYGYYLSVGTHTVTITANANYSIDNATITFNGQTVQNGGTITINAGDVSFTLAASGATPADTSVVIEGGNGSDMGLTDYLLIVLVILIVIMAIMVAMRLMRS
ncbi:hypothetical protein JS82_06665 [Methanomassiliicoccaceae archaeon DOK]|nr:hypothetical protein JS82_06665 [Methanomassiliicoccaceae archaeon DOK]